MIRVNKQADIEAYSAGQMFALVNDIESYPQFLPWCTASTITARGDDTLTASISVAVGGIKQQFTTSNTMQKDTAIYITLVKGPFKALKGCWRFKDNDHGGCSVRLEMQFEFKNKLLQQALGRPFQKITDSLIDAFIERAQFVYGR